MHSALCAYFAGNCISVQKNKEEFYKTLEESWAREQSNDPPSC